MKHNNDIRNRLTLTIINLLDNLFKHVNVLSNAFIYSLLKCIKRKCLFAKISWKYSFYVTHIWLTYLMKNFSTFRHFVLQIYFYIICCVTSEVHLCSTSFPKVTTISFCFKIYCTGVSIRFPEIRWRQRKLTRTWLSYNIDVQQN